MANSGNYVVLHMKTMMCRKCGQDKGKALFPKNRRVCRECRRVYEKDKVQDTSLVAQPTQQRTVGSYSCT